MTLVGIKETFAPVEALRRIWTRYEDRYEPSRHYMRGPGPKARARAAQLSREQAGSRPA